MLWSMVTGRPPRKLRCIDALMARYRCAYAGLLAFPPSMGTWAGQPGRCQARRKEGGKGGKKKTSGMARESPTALSLQVSPLICRLGEISLIFIQRLPSCFRELVGE